MNNMKKLASLLLALVMVLAMAVPAMAAEVDGETTTTPTTYTITISNTASGHTYEAYQIFTGSLGDNGELGDIKWGANVSAEGQTALGDAATKAESLTEVNVKAFADEVAKYLTGTPTEGTVHMETGEDGKEKVKNYTISGLVAGYYLVKDQDGSLQGDNDTYTEYLLKVVKDTETAPKGNAPTVEKKVDDKNDSNNTEDAEDWQDSADYDIGDSVPFQLKATLAGNVSAYDTYKIVFHDTLSAGLTYEDITKVTVDGVEVENGYVVKTSTNEETGITELTITFADVTKQGATDNSVVIVEYTAILNESANIGADGNPNTVYLEYSNNPNWDSTPNGKDDDGDGKVDDEDDDGDEPTGDTPVDKVIVFTYQTIVNKKDENGAALTGAGFTLYKKNATGEYVAVGEEVTGEAMTQFVWSGLDDGDYKIVETTTPSGYNTIADIFFTIEATHSEIADEPVLNTLVVKDAEGSVISNPDDEEATFNADLAKGEVSTDVINISGAELPQTGGMGTTVIYVIGCLMVAGAAIVLFAKKRAAK